MVHLSQQLLNFFILLRAQSFCTTVKFGVVFFFFFLNQSEITMTNLSREFLMNK